MKKSIVFVMFVALFLLTSCGAYTRTMLGVTEKDLIETVSVEQGCPREKIKILSKIKKIGNATYSLDVCGKRVVYKQVGSVFMTAEKADKMIK